MITQALNRRVSGGEGREPLQLLGAVYKQLDAPYGAFNHWLIVASTNGIKADDATYEATERAIQSLAARRDSLVGQMRDVLTGARHGHDEQLIRRGFELLERAAVLARG